MGGGTVHINNDRLGEGDVKERSSSSVNGSYGSTSDRAGKKSGQVFCRTLTMSSLNADVRLSACYS